MIKHVVYISTLCKRINIEARKNTDVCISSIELFFESPKNAPCLKLITEMDDFT